VFATNPRLRLVSKGKNTRYAVPALIRSYPKTLIVGRFSESIPSVIVQVSLPFAYVVIPESAMHGISSPLDNPVPRSAWNSVSAFAKVYSREVYFVAASVLYPGSTSFALSYASK
jgi:hypothetical protein